MEQLKYHFDAEYAVWAVLKSDSRSNQSAMPQSQYTALVHNIKAVSLHALHNTPPACRSASTSLLAPPVSPLLLLDLPLACSTLQQQPAERVCPQGLLAHLPQVMRVNSSNAHAHTRYLGFGAVATIRAAKVAAARTISSRHTHAHRKYVYCIGTRALGCHMRAAPPFCALAPDPPPPSPVPLTPPPCLPPHLQVLQELVAARTLSPLRILIRGPPAGGEKRSSMALRHWATAPWLCGLKHSATAPYLAGPRDRAKALCSLG